MNMQSIRMLLSFILLKIIVYVYPLIGIEFRPRHIRPALSIGFGQRATDDDILKCCKELGINVRRIDL